MVSQQGLGCGITKDNDAYCWGQSGYSGDGDGNTSSSNVPKLAVMYPRGRVLDIITLAYGSCALIEK